MCFILIINQKVLYVGMGICEVLDVVLVIVVFGVKIGVLFFDDGIFQIIKNQNIDFVGQKNMVVIFKLFVFYDIDYIFVRVKDLVLWGLIEEDFFVEVQLVEDDVVLDFFC